MLDRLGPGCGRPGLRDLREGSQKEALEKEGAGGRKLQCTKKAILRAESKERKEERTFSTERDFSAERQFARVSRFLSKTAVTVTLLGWLE